MVSFGKPQKCNERAGMGNRAVVSVLVDDMTVVSIGKIDLQIIQRIEWAWS